MKVVHCLNATLPYRNTLLTIHPASQVLPESNWRNVFLYGRGVRERSEFYRLKAGYFTLKFHPHMVHALRIELSSSG